MNEKRRHGARRWQPTWLANLSPSFESERERLSPILEELTMRYMKLPGVTGVGTSVGEQGGPAIVINLLDEDAVNGLPSLDDRVDTYFMVTGRFYAVGQ
jgi:hypothetical protein